MDDHAPRRTISPERKSLYSAGLVLQGLGGIGFLVCFIGFVLGGQRAVDTVGQSGSPFAWWGGAGVCVALLGIGGWMRHIGARGIAGSGLVLDPERARKDLEPWARMGGGMVQDALDEAGIDVGRAPPTHAQSGTKLPGGGQPVTAVKCGHCHTLNDANAKFCDECGARL